MIGQNKRTQQDANEGDLLQTTFIEQQMMQEGRAPAPLMDQALPVKKSKISPRALILIVSISFAMVLFLILILLQFLQGTDSVQQQLVDLSRQRQTPTYLTAELEQVIERLEQDLELADPTPNEYPFPPIRYSLYIIPKKN